MTNRHRWKECRTDPSWWRSSIEFSVRRRLMVNTQN